MRRTGSFPDSSKAFTARMSVLPSTSRASSLGGVPIPRTPVVTAS
jgi:hypothetical protein